MKILLVSLHFVEYAIELACALSQSHSVHLVLSKPKVLKTVGESLDNLLNKKVKYTIFEKYSGKDPRILGNVIKLLKLLYQFRPDVIHIQESYAILNVILFLTPLAKVVTIHDVSPHFGTKLRHPKLFYFARKYLYDKIIVHGERLRKELIKKLGRSPRDIFVVPHGCLFSFNNSPDNTIEEEEKTILFFGRMEKYKGLEYLIEAVPLVSKEIYDFKVIVAGTGEDLDKHKDLIKNDSCFEVHDQFIPNSEVSRFFYLSSVVVLPYVEASQSGIVAMAFAFGKPVIVTDVGSLSEMVEDGKTGIIIPPRDVKALADAIIFLLQDKDVRKRLGNEALRVANNDLSWEKIAILTQEIYAK